MAIETVKQLERRVKLYLEVNRFQTAIKLLKETMEDEGECPRLLNLLGVIYHRQSRFSQAIKSFKRAIELEPKCIEASLNLSIVYCDLGLYDQGRGEYQKLAASYSSPSAIPPIILSKIASLHCETAESYKASGLYAEAQKEYEKALTICPSMPDQIINLAKLEYDMGHLTKAKSRAREMVDGLAPNASAYNLLGLIAYHENDLVSARNYWMKSQEIEPNDKTSKALIRCISEIDQDSA